MSDAPERWLSELYRASAREEAPTSLDARILAEARTSLRSRTSRFSNWGAPLAAAAVVVVTVSLVIAMREDTDFTDRSTGARGTPQAPAPSVASPEAARPEAVGPAQQAMKQRRDASPHEPNGASQPSGDRQVASEAKGRAEPPAAAPVAKAELAERPAAPPPPASPSTPLSAPEARDQAPAQGAPAASFPSKALGKLSGSGDPSTEQQRATESAERASARSRSAAGNEVARRMEAAAESPETWLERIVKLRNEGKITEAKQSLVAFKERYPDHPLPPALKDW